MFLCGENLLSVDAKTALQKKTQLIILHVLDILFHVLVH